MAVGVPIFAVIYAALKRYINKLLARKKLPTNTKEYLYVEEIRNKEFILLQDDSRNHKSATKMGQERDTLSQEENGKKGMDKSNCKNNHD